MNKKPINQPLNPNRPPIVPNAAPVVPGAPRDLGENARLKVLEDRLVPKNTKRIIKEIPDFDALLESDFVYISNDDSELRKIRAIKLNSAIEGLSYSAIYDASEEIEGSPAGHTLYLPAEYFNRVPIINEEVFLYVYIDNPADEYAATWAATAKIIDERLSSQAKKDIADDKDADNIAEILSELDTVEVLILDGCIDILAGLSADIKRNLEEEIARAKAAEEQLAADISSETRARQEADAMLLQRLIDETQARQEADNQLNQKIDYEITVEKTARENADATLQANIDTEETRAKEVEADLDAKIEQEIADRKQAIIDEAEARNNAIQVETDRATAAENTLNTAITNEAATRAESIAAEKARAEGAEQGLAARLDNIDTGLQVADGNVTVLNNATVEGDLNVKGTTTTVDQETIQSQAQIIVTNSNNATVIDQTGIVALKGTYTAYEVTAENYKANTFYYEYEPNKYQLDESATYTEGRQYYVANAEGIGLYKADEDALLLGEGIYYGGNFEFNAGQGQKIATRSNDLVSGNLTQWDDTNHTLVDSGINAQTIAQQVDEVRQELAQEILDRTADDATLQANIEAENTRATSEEQRIEGNLNTEISNRQAAIEALDAESIGQDGSYLKTIVEADGIITATAQGFDVNFTTPTDNNAPTTQAVKAKFETDAFIIVDNVADIQNYTTSKYNGCFIKYTGEDSGKYKKDYIYKIVFTEAPQPINPQGTATIIPFTTIDVYNDLNLSTDRITAPATNPKSSAQANRLPAAGMKNYNVLTDSGFSGYTVAEDLKQNIIWNADTGSEQATFYKYSSAEYPITINADKSGILLGFATSARYGSTKDEFYPDTETFADLLNIVYSTHTLKFDYRTKDANFKTKLNLYAETYLADRRVNDTSNEIIGSLWIKYTNLLGQTVTTKINEKRTSVEVPAGSGDGTWTQSVADTLDINLNLKTILADVQVSTEDDVQYKNIELIYALGGYKPYHNQGNVFQLSYGIGLFGWAAFTGTAVEVTEYEGIEPPRADRWLLTVNEEDTLNNAISAINAELETKQDELTTSSVADGDLDKAIGFDAEGNLVKGEVEGSIVVDLGLLDFSQGLPSIATTTITQEDYDKLVVAKESSITFKPSASLIFTCPNTDKYSNGLLVYHTTHISDASTTGIIAIDAFVNSNLNVQVLVYNYLIANNYDSSATEDDYKFITEYGVKRALETLAVNEVSVGAANTLSSISETDGKISATVTPIQIAESQVTSLETDLANKQDKLPTINLGTISSQTERKTLTEEQYNTILNNENCYIEFKFGPGTYVIPKISNVTDDPADYAQFASTMVYSGSIMAIFAMTYYENSPRVYYIDIYMSEIRTSSTVSSGSTSLITSGGVYDGLATKQDTLTFDSTPTDSSINPVTSEGIYNALATKQDNLIFATDTDIDDIFTSVSLNEGDNISNDTLNLGNETSINQNGDTIIL